MNAARLREILDKLSRENSFLRIGKLLGAVQSAVSNLVSSPTDSGHQQQYVTSLGALREGTNKLRAAFEPPEIAQIEDLTGGREYLSDVAQQISDWMAENPATPAIVLDNISKLVEARNQFMTLVTQGSSTLKELGIEVYELEPGEAEIGFLLPRGLFDNEFDKLLKELNALKRTIRAFSEAATGSVEPIVVKQISTTDPLFTFAMNAATIMMIGRVAKWAIDAWKTVEEIRNLRAQTAQLKAPAAAKIEATFEEVIKQTIEDALSGKLEEIMKSLNGDGHRKHEQKTDLDWALRSIMSRVERGMVVEIRMLPPPVSAVDDPNIEVEPPQTRAMREVAKSLTFPPMKGEPILQIPSLREKKGEHSEGG
ncbi:hypothetical protein FKO01_25380 [Mesorhizobium sp. B2-3-3]|nr:hypothetical protein FKO01_25380 [Mesorhizobium sp. B2-3-3]